jgi:hypothetical protein
LGEDPKPAAGVQVLIHVFECIRLLMSGASGIFEQAFSCIMRRFRASPVRQNLENHMRKGALLLALVFAVSASTAALAAKKKMAKPAADPAVAAQNNSMHFIQDAFGGAWMTPAPSEPKKVARVKKKKKAG